MTLTKEAASARSETHFFNPEGAFPVPIQTTGTQFQAPAPIAQTLIFIALIARSALAPTTHLMNTMESALLATTLITGIKPQECASFARKPMSLISSKENVSVLKSCPMILAFNVSTVSGQNIGMKIQERVNNVRPILIILKAS